MRSKIKPFWLVLILALLSSSAAYAASVENIRLWPAPDHVRLVFDLSSPVSHRIFALENPHRVVIDINDARLRADLARLDLSGSPIRKVRTGAREGKDLRVVLDLGQALEYRSFLLKPNGQYGDRLVVDLVLKETQSAAKAPSQPVKKLKEAEQTRRDVVVVVDAGHGGEDPGAIGPGGIREKDVVLAIAQELHRLLQAEKGVTAHLTRSGDYYIGLRKRTQLARRHNADLFISIHADAFHRPQASGASVYAISQRGATSETARWLAERENNSDLIGGVGGVSLDDKDDLLAGVLLDLSMTASLNASLSLGDRVLKSMGQVAKLHKPKVEQAGFVVLKSPDIPSLLVETGFISNPAESKRLGTKSYQRQLASSIKQGIMDYLNDTPPPGTYLAWRKNGGDAALVATAQEVGSGHTTYVIGQGDTLSGIAQKNNISIDRLRQANGLSSDLLRVGQVIQIPSS